MSDGGGEEGGVSSTARPRSEGPEGGSGILEEFDLLHIDLQPEAQSPGTEGASSGCSKNVLRKQKNWEKTLAAKKGRRKEEKQRKKLRQAEESGSAPDSPRHSKRVVKAITRERLLGAADGGPRLCVDLSMTGCMSHKELSRLAGQIRRLYGSNRRAARPFHLYLAELRADSQLYRECVRKNAGFENYVMDVTERSCLQLFPRESVVYLTPDSEDVLEHVDPEKVYILGGLVDESVQKKLTYQKARQSQLSTARLPIDEYMVKKDNDKNFHSKILAINQVFDILLRFRETGSWSAALQAGVPPGKGYVVAPELRAPCPLQEDGAGQGPASRA